MTRIRTWSSLLLLALVITGAQAHDGTTPEPAKDRIEKLLDRMAAAANEKQRNVARKELYDLGETAAPHLRSIINRGALAQEVLARIERSKLPAVENKRLRARAELVVHGAGSGPPGAKRPPSFQLWLQVENLTGEKITLPQPTITSTDGEFRVDRWYEEDGEGQPWDGLLMPNEKKSIYVIGTAGDRVTAEMVIRVKVSLDSLNIELRTTVLKGLALRCPCGCDRSEIMIEETRKQESNVGLSAIEKALASIAEREKRGYVTEQMLSHRLRLLRLAEEIQSRDW